MPNLLLAAIVALLISGKTSKRKLEKILHASRFRTSVYAVLSLIVAIIFYKTYQVASIMNLVQVAGIKQAIDKNNNVVDTINSVYIYKRFGKNPMHRDAFNGYVTTSKTNENEPFGKSKRMLDLFGGAEITIQALNHPDTFKMYNFDGMTDNDLQEIAHSFAQHNLPLDSITHLYQIDFLATSLPSLMPFYPKFEKHDSLHFLDKHVFCYDELSNSRNNPSISFYKGKKNDNLSFTQPNVNEETNQPSILNNGFCFYELIGTKKSNEIQDDVTDLKFVGSSNIINNLDFFTAADISQYNYIISLNSNCPVRELVIDFDIPIETARVSDHMQIFTHGILFDSIMVKELQDNPAMEFLIKIPSLTNLQLIRSLILTTILTALLSLFFNNLYYSICNWAYSRRKKNRIPYKEAKLLSQKTRRKIKSRAKVFKRLLNLLVFIYLLIIFAFSIIVFIDTSILLPFFLFDYAYIALAGLLLLFIPVIIVYFAYKYVRRPLTVNEQESENDEENNVNNFTIFEHEKTKEEEMDELFERHMKEMELLKENNNSAQENDLPSPE